MPRLKVNSKLAPLITNEARHAQEVMKDLGITYQHSTPQSMGDCWWFWNCEDIPEDLPQYLSVSDRDPMNCIGYGLSQQDAERIRDGLSAKA